MTNDQTKPDSPVHRQESRLFVWSKRIRIGKQVMPERLKAKG
jgi:hypothetical protein